MSNDVLKAVLRIHRLWLKMVDTHIFLHFVGPDGKEDTIYSSTSVGGEKETTAGKGLNEATNSLDKFFYLKDIRAWMREAV